jgi:hypothetical protein
LLCRIADDEENVLVLAPPTERDVANTDARPPRALARRVLETAHDWAIASGKAAAPRRVRMQTLIVGPQKESEGKKMFVTKIFEPPRCQREGKKHSFPPPAFTARRHMARAARTHGTRCTH